MAFPNAPTPLSYGPPNVSFEGLDKLGQNYFEGAEQRRKYDLARAFQGGLPTDPNTGQVDFRAVTEKLAKYGDVSHIGPLSTLDLQRGFLDEAKNQDAREFGPQSTPQATPQTAPLRAPSQGPSPTQPAGRGAMSQPALSSAGTDNEGAMTLRGMATEIFGGRDVSPLIPRFAAAFKVDPDAPLTPEQASALKPVMGKSLDAMGGLRPPSGMPGPQVAQAQSPAASQSAAPQIGAVIDPSLGGLVPKAFMQKYGNDAPGKWIEYASKRAELLAGAGQKGMSEVWLKRAQDVAIALQKASEPTPDLKNAVASGMRSPLDYENSKVQGRVAAENQAFTTEQKNARASGPMTPLDYTKTQEQQKDDVVRYGKQLQAIQGSAQAANRQLQHIQFAEGIYNDPNFYSGTLEGVNLAYKKIMNAIDPNNKEALPQEAFRKTMAAAVLNQVEQLKDDTAAVGGGGRIFQSQIELMEKAANNPDNTVPANRLLTEIAKRAALESKKVAAMANKYKGGHLDADFAQSVDDHYTKNPMFTPAEMADVRLIAPPSFQNAKQAAAAKLPPGTPIKIGGDWYKSP